MTALAAMVRRAPRQGRGLPAVAAGAPPAGVFGGWKDNTLMANLPVESTVERWPHGVAPSVGGRCGLLGYLRSDTP
jgi:hypothetical protein